MKISVPNHFGLKMKENDLKPLYRCMWIPCSVQTLLGIICLIITQIVLFASDNSKLVEREFSQNFEYAESGVHWP